MASELIRHEVQVLRVASSAVNSSSDSIAGNFRLSWGDGGEETDYLPADVGEVELKAALEALVEVRDVQVGVVHGFKIQRLRKSAQSVMFRCGLSTDLDAVLAKLSRICVGCPRICYANACEDQPNTCCSVGGCRRV